ncbi:hypothetical protein BWI96_17020 [Siphonobacter sp. SORGH_AS_0500]|nr:hypothetical protein BWI96_17020 [Siphonobacter sp. SORGH_AS_0500]
MVDGWVISRMKVTDNEFINRLLLLTKTPCRHGPANILRAVNHLPNLRLAEGKNLKRKTNNQQL